MSPADARRMARAVRAIVEERERQLGVEGFTAEHDDAHTKGELADAASAYASAVGTHARIQVEQIAEGSELSPADWRALYRQCSAPGWWPWAIEWWKPKDPRSSLVRAGALIVAEIERIDRAEERQRGDDVPPGAVLAELKAGDVLVADARFTCIDAGARVTVEATERGALFVACADGQHLLDGQVDAHGRLRGLSLAPAGDAP